MVVPTKLEESSFLLEFLDLSNYNLDMSRTIHTIPHIERECKRKMYEINKKSLSVAMLNAGVKSAKDLAALAGVSANTISRINNGGRATLSTAQAMATALGVPVAEILAEV